MIKLHPETINELAEIINGIEVVNDLRANAQIDCQANYDSWDIRQRRKHWERCSAQDSEYNSYLVRLYADFGIELPCYRFIDLIDNTMKLTKAVQ